MEHKTRTDFLASIDADEYTNKVYNEMQEEMMFRIFFAYQGTIFTIQTKFNTVARSYHPY